MKVPLCIDIFTVSSGCFVLFSITEIGEISCTMHLMVELLRIGKLYIIIHCRRMFNAYVNTLVMLMALIIIQECIMCVCISACNRYHMGTSALSDMYATKTRGPHAFSAIKYPKLDELYMLPN